MMGQIYLRDVWIHLIKVNMFLLFWIAFLSDNGFWFSKSLRIQYHDLNNN